MDFDDPEMAQAASDLDGSQTPQEFSRVLSGWSSTRPSRTAK